VCSAPFVSTCLIVHGSYYLRAFVYKWSDLLTCIRMMKPNLFNYLIGL
jgi:hypothetical protein